MHNLIAATLALTFVVVAAPTDAEAKLAFFRNYPDLQWNVIKTEHFNVFYPKTRNPNAEHQLDGEFTARKTAFVAEEMYPLVCGQFNFYLDETINIVMLDQTDSLTGYTVPNYDWIVVSGRHSDLLWRLRGHHDWLRNVMYHEFAHVVSLKADHVFAEEAFGALVSARWSDGRINTNAAAGGFIMKGDPWFWVEGGAEYYTEVAGINTWTSNREMRMRMDTLEDTLLNFDDMGDYFGSNGGFDGNRHYLSGYSFALYLEERFGEGVYQSFALNREESGWSPNFLSVMEETLNISADDLYDDWRVWLKTKYEAVEAEVMKDPAIGERVAYRGYVPYFESLHPDSREKDAQVREFKGGDKYKWRRDREADGVYAWAARFTNDGGRAGVFNLNARGVQVVSIPEDVLTPFGSDARQEVPYVDDVLVAESTSYVQRLLPATGDSQFDFSPDGNKAVYVCAEDAIALSKAEAKDLIPTKRNLNLDGYSWHQLCIVDLVQWDANERDYYVEKLGYSPRERADLKLEMQRRGVTPPKFDSEEKAGLKAKEKRAKKDVEKAGFFMHAPVSIIGGDTPERRVSYPAWSPDGNLIAYTKYADARQELWVWDLAKNEGRALTNFSDGTRFESIDWSPDGTQLVVGSYRWNQNDIYVYDLQGNGRPLTMDRFEDRDPHWGHDGNIYFTSDRVGGIFNVFKLNPRLEPGVLDTDLDGLLDHEDQCPTEPETRNLFKDSDGCPDTVPVRVTADKVEIDEKVFFELDKAIIKAESHELLNAVARVIVENPQLEAIEVAGHTDSQGEEEYNQELSERRAEAVMTYLVGQGVAAERLASAGYGQTVPLVEGDTEEAFATNRRVEFTITKQSERTEIVEQETTEAEAVYACGEGPEAERLGNAYLVQVTNVVSGAFTPWLTPKGHLMYANYTPHGWKQWGLNCADFHNTVVDDTTLVIAEADYKLDVPQEVYPDYSAVTSTVPMHGQFWRSPLLIPIIELGNVSLTHIGFSIAAYFNVSDVLDTNEISAYAEAGENIRLQIFYQNKRSFVEWRAFMFAGILKFDYGFNLDDDGDSATTDDQFLADIKQGFAFMGGGGAVTIPFGPARDVFDIDISAFGYGRAVKGVSDGKKYRPLDFRLLNTIELELVSPSIARAVRWGNPNPRGGRAFSFSWSPNYVRPLNRATGGVSVDDGQVFEDYFFNEFHVNYSEYLKLPWKKPNGESANHTLQLNLELGFIDRNVPYIDEIHGGASGGFQRSQVLRSATTFAGYESWSLAGETAALVNLQYRFPIARQIDVKVGPLYIESIYMQVFGTVGNFWSYDVKPDAQTADLFGERVLADPETRKGGGLDQPGSGVFREYPGIVASENGWPILADAGVELRFAMNTFNRASWFSSIRVAYGFMGVSGRGDVDGDDVYTNSSDPTLDNRSDEREPAGFRFMIGIGQGW